MLKKLTTYTICLLELVFIGYIIACYIG